MVQLTRAFATLALTFAAVQAAPNLSARQSIPDPAGEKNVGNGAGIQFVGGQCLGAADCASGCCATLPRGGETIGVCSGIGAQNQAGKQGCGFEAAGGGGGGAIGGGNNNNNNGVNDNFGNGNNGNNNNNNDFGNGNGNNGGNNNNGNGNNGNGNNGGGNAGAAQPSTLQPDPAGEKNVGNGAGVQFVGGQCLGDEDCASGCCALVNTGAESFGICSGIGANTQNGKQGCGFPQGGGQLSG